MSDIKKIKLDYLTEEEIIEFYELFFGNILIRKKDFSYYSNLSKCLAKENFVKSILDKLNDNEIEILRILSKNIYLSYNYLIEKLNILLDMPTPLINKSINNLIHKKYIFQREPNKLVIPDIYFSVFKKIEYKKRNNENLSNYSSKYIIDINNLINYFITTEMKPSNSLSLYKKDLLTLKELFSSYSKMDDNDYNLTAYFYSINFINKSDELILKNIKKYFSLTSFDRALYFIKKVFPSIYSILNYFYKENESVKIKISDFKKLWSYTFLLTDYYNPPVKFHFEKKIDFLEKLNIIKIENDFIHIIKYKNNETDQKDEIRLTSSFNFYINADSSRKDFYFSSLFCDFVKYNKIVEYEITEESIKRGISHGLEFENVLDFIKNYKIKLSPNVEQTVKQWFDKYASYYYIDGTVFICHDNSKGKIINSLINKGFIKAYEIKKEAIYLIPDQERKSFFNFLDKTGINYYNKKPKEIPDNKDEMLVNLCNVLEESDN